MKQALPAGQLQVVANRHAGAYKSGVVEEISRGIQSPKPARWLCVPLSKVFSCSDPGGVFRPGDAPFWLRRSPVQLRHPRSRVPAEQLRTKPERPAACLRLTAPRPLRQLQRPADNVVFEIFVGARPSRSPAHAHARTRRQMHRLGVAPTRADASPIKLPAFANQHIGAGGRQPAYGFGASGVSHTQSSHLLEAVFVGRGNGSYHPSPADGSLNISMEGPVVPASSSLLNSNPSTQALQFEISQVPVYPGTCATNRSST